MEKVSGIHHTFEGTFDSRLYGDQLTTFCHENQVDVKLSKLTLDLQKKWKEDVDQLDKKQKAEEEFQRTKKNNRSFFVDSKLVADLSVPLTEEEFEVSQERVNSTFSGASSEFCYLCTTMEEHRAHLKTKKRINGKPRVQYIAPPPTVPVKPKEEKPEAEEVLFKVVIKTGEQIDAGTSTPIFITLKGEKNALRKRQLTKKCGSLGFRFNRCTKEMFHLKGPEIGELRKVIVEHEGSKKEDGWFIEEMSINNMRSKETWSIKCWKWLSMWHTDYLVKREFYPKKDEIIQRSFKVSTYTGKHALAGTHARAFITLFGSKGNSEKVRLKNDSSENFNRGQRDDFSVVVDDFGYLRGIRIEHDNSSAGKYDEDSEKSSDVKLSKSKQQRAKSTLPDTGDSSWFLEKVVVKDLDNGKRYEFVIGDWLGIENGEGSLHKDVMLPEKEMKKGTDKEPDEVLEDVFYDIIIKTGKESLAGTDSTVSVTLFGKKGATKKFRFEDKKKDLFEKGQTDTFRVSGADVGSLTRLKIWHSDTGVAAGWYLDGIVVKKYFSKGGIIKYLNEMKSSGQLPPGLTLQEGKVEFTQLLKPGSEEDSSLEDSDEDEEKEFMRKARQRGDKMLKTKRRQTKKKPSTIEEEDEDDDDEDMSGGGRRGNRRRKKEDSEDSEEEARARKKKLNYDDEDDDEEEAARRRKKQKKKDSSDPDSSDYDAKKKRKQQKKMKKKKKNNSEDSSDSDSSDSATNEKRQKSRNAARVRLPFAEEVNFPCHNWLASDEGDGKCERMLTAQNCKLLTSELNVRVFETTTKSTDKVKPKFKKQR